MSGIGGGGNKVIGGWGGPGMPNCRKSTSSFGFGVWLLVELELLELR
jgi:hypothetical protein